MTIELDKALTLTHEQLVEAFVAMSADDLRQTHVLLATAARNGTVTLAELDRIIAAGEVAARRLGVRAERLRSGILAVLDGGLANDGTSSN